MKPPEDIVPLKFLTSIFVSKVGTAIAFVLIFYLAQTSLNTQWMSYTFIWWLMFAIGEIGQTINPKYSWTEAIAGIISETIYFPLSMILILWLL